MGLFFLVLVLGSLITFLLSYYKSEWFLFLIIVVVIVSVIILGYFEDKPLKENIRYCADVNGQTIYFGSFVNFPTAIEGAEKEMRVSSYYIVEYGWFRKYVYKDDSLTIVVPKGSSLKITDNYPQMNPPYVLTK